MKVLGIVGSPRKKGNTEVLIEEALSGARALGAEVEMIRLAEKNILPCDGCESCKKTGKCKIQDDMPEIYRKLLEADGIIFGTPVYFWGVSAQAKILIDRTYVFLGERKLKNKVAGVITVARRAGATSAFSAFHDFFNIHRMITAGGAIGFAPGPENLSRERGGGAIAYGDKRGDVRQDERGMAEAAALGRAVVRTIKVLQSPEK